MMKKLIKELEEELAKEINTANEELSYILGFAAAKNIVKSCDPWIPISELPPERGNTKMFSIVVIMSDGINTDLGYYDFEYKQWIHKSMGSDFIPIKWTYLPDTTI